MLRKASYRFVIWLSPLAVAGGLFSHRLFGHVSEERFAQIRPRVKRASFRFVIWLFPFVIVASLFAYWVLDHVNHEQLRQLKPGMTKAEVIAILGEPHISQQNNDSWGYWGWDNDPYYVSFDNDGRLVW